MAPGAPVKPGNCDMRSEPSLKTDINIITPCSDPIQPNPNNPDPEPHNPSPQPSQNTKPNNRDKDTRTLKHNPAQPTPSKSNINAEPPETSCGKLSNYPVKPNPSSETSQLMNGGTLVKKGPSPPVVILEKLEPESDQQGNSTIFE